MLMAYTKRSAKCLHNTRVAVHSFYVCFQNYPLRLLNVVFMNQLVRWRTTPHLHHRPLAVN